MTRCLITGASGFVGRHVADIAAARGMDVIGLSRQSYPNEQGSDHLLNIVQCDLTRNISALRETVRRFAPEAIVHLAATSFEPFVASQPWRVIHNNLRATLNLLRACRERASQAVLVIASSSAVYGRDPGHTLPLVEEYAPAPLTIYGVSKLAVEALAMQHHRAHGLRVVIARPFNLTGPGEHASFVTSAFARQIALVEAGRQSPVVRVGNLQTTRDFLDVRDAAAALVSLTQLTQYGEAYNLCSGIAVNIGDLLEKLLHLSTMKIRAEAGPSLARAVEIQAQVGDPSKLRRATGWQPHHTLDQTLYDVLGFWRKRTKEERI